MTPFAMYTNPTRGIGLAAAVSAGTIASSIGSASVVPMARRNIRRGSAFLVTNIFRSSSSWPTGHEVHEAPQITESLTLVVVLRPIVCFVVARPNITATPLLLLRHSHLERPALHHAHDQR